MIPLHPARPLRRVSRATTLLTRTCRAFHTSRRTPMRNPLRFLITTPSQRIDDMLHEYGLAKWGFVVYRCTYREGDDALWARFMTILRTRTRLALKEDGQPDLAEKMEWTVQEDPEFEGLSKTEIRERFQAWAALVSKDEMSAPNKHIDSARLQFNPRFNFCIHVDADSLDSVVNNPASMVQELPYLDMSSYVNILDGNWKPPPKKDKSELAPDEMWDDPWSGEGEGVEEDIEGCKLKNVGWMKLSLEGLIPDVYNMLTQRYLWHSIYCRPPYIASG